MNVFREEEDVRSGRSRQYSKEEKERRGWSGGGWGNPPPTHTLHRSSEGSGGVSSNYGVENELAATFAALDIDAKPGDECLGPPRMPISLKRMPRRSGIPQILEVSAPTTPGY